MSNWTIQESVDLALDAQRQKVGAPEALMLPGDNQAHTWRVTVLSDGEAVDLTGATSAGYFLRADGETVACVGSVAGNAVSVTLAQECYAIEGLMRGIIRVTLATGAVITLSEKLFRVRQDIGDQIIDPGEVIPGIDELLAQIAALESATSAANTVISSAAKTVGYTIFSELERHNGSLSNSSGAWSNVSSANHQHTVIPVSGGDVVKIEASSVRAATYAFLTAYEQPTSSSSAVYYAGGATKPTVVSIGRSVTVTAPDDAKYLYVHTKYSGTDFETGITINGLSWNVGIVQNYNGLTGSIAENAEAIDALQPENLPRATYYVAPNGDDTADGMSTSTPLATIDKALESGAETVLLMGGVYSQQITTAKIKRPVTIAAADKSDPPILYAPGSLLAASASVHAGSIKYIEYAGTAFTENNVWIFQDGVEDESTIISDAERHALQRGQRTRCRDTRIVKCTASTLADALTEMASAYKWYYDSDSGRLYFSSPEEITAAKPLRSSFGALLFTSTDRAISVKLSCLRVKYMGINVNGFVSATVADCTCENFTGAGAITWDGVSGAQIVRCEAASCSYKANLGDGFNAHAVSSALYARDTSAVLIDCWAHDCQDDGFSDHGGCESTIIGGLFEHNGTGVTPAYGSHGAYYNVLSRANGDYGFYCVGGATDGGVGTQMACHGCVSDGNSAAGFRYAGAYSEGLLSGCAAINEAIGYQVVSGSGVAVTAVNCSTADCTTARSGEISIKAGTALA